MRPVLEEGSAVLGGVYHPACLNCAHCGDRLTDTVHRTDDGKLYCEIDFREGEGGGEVLVH